MSVRVPTYRKHSSGQAMVEIKGRRYYLGPYNSDESKERYKAMVAQYLRKKSSLQGFGSSAMTITILVAAYREHCESYYIKDGNPSSELSVIRIAMRHLRELYGNVRADEFGPLALRTVQGAIEESGVARVTVNKYLTRIRRMFAWAVSEELLPETVYRALQTVQPLKKGRSKAREMPPVSPVSREEVERTVPYLAPQLRAMVWLQWHTGMRPNEVAQMRPCDIKHDERTQSWIYTPRTHKNAHKGKVRPIALIQSDYEILKPWLDRPEDACCFSPAEAVAYRNEEKRRRRKSRVQPSQYDRSRRHPIRRPGAKYSTNAYRLAIQRACRQYAIDSLLKAGSTLAEAEAKVKAGYPRWSPNQLRHSALTAINSRFGIDAARCVGGHADATMTATYAERDYARAVEIRKSMESSDG